jgi:tRNA-specific adenosine deaminase 2
MTLTFQLAQHALSLSEVPIACVIVHPDLGTLSTGYNLVNHTRDATRHAELVALDRLFTNGQSSDKLCIDNPPIHPSQPSYVERSVEECLKLVAESTVYVNCEPCIQCAAALRNVGCVKVVYGCCNPRFGGNGSLMDLHSSSFLSDDRAGYEVTRGVREDEAVNVLRMFYDCENMSAPEEKRTKKEGKEKRANYDGFDGFA